MTEADEVRTRNDRARAARLAGGDMDALAEIYDAYSGPLFRLALGLTGSVPDAEDVLSNVFLKLVRRRGGPIRELRAYLFTAARHEAYSSLRLSRRETSVEEPLLYTPPASENARRSSPARRSRTSACVTSEFGRARSVSRAARFTHSP
jgi:DNA-directed RNA polymerase specialized sigma24 family protein